MADKKDDKDKFKPRKTNIADIIAQREARLKKAKEQGWSATLTDEAADISRPEIPDSAEVLDSGDLIFLRKIGVLGENEDVIPKPSGYNIGHDNDLVKVLTSRDGEEVKSRYTSWGMNMKTAFFEHGLASGDLKEDKKFEVHVHGFLRAVAVGYHKFLRPKG